MFVYITLALYYMICIPLEKSILKRLKTSYWTIFLIIPLFVLTAFRDVTVGSDTPAYKWMYDFFSSQSLFDSITINIETGYAILNRLIGKFNSDFHVFQVIYSLMIFIPLFLLLKKYSKNIAFSLFIYVTFRLFFFSMTGMRQSLAMAIMMLSIPYIEKRNPVKFGILLAIATSIHSSAIIFTFLYIVKIKGYSIKIILRIIAISIITLLTSDFWISIFTNIFPKYGTYIVRVNTYDGIFVYIQTSVILAFIIFGLVVNRSNKTYGLKEIKTVKKKISIEEIALSGLILAFVFSLFATHINIAGRLARYFHIIIMIYLPNTVEKINNSRVRLIMYYLITVMLLVYYIIVLNVRPEWDGILPYVWRFN